MLTHDRRPSRQPSVRRPDGFVQSRHNFRHLKWNVGGDFPVATSAVVTAGEVESSAREAARVAIDERLLVFGVETQDALEMQADFQFLRQLRRAWESVRNKGLWTILSVAMIGLVVLIAAGVKQSLGGPE